MFEAIGIRKTFYARTANEVRALQGVDLRIEEGSFVIIIGTNGSGSPRFSTPRLDRSSSMRGGCVWPGATSRPGLSIVGPGSWDGFSRIPTAARRRTSQRQQLREKVNRLNMGLEDRLDNPIGNLSGGQRQALTLLMATWRRPDLLLLDEHTAALDPKSADQVIRLTEQVVSEHGLTTLMVTHSMQQAVSLGDRLIMMYRGRIIHDFAGAMKRRLRVHDLLERFEEVRRGEQLDETVAELLQRSYV